MIDYIVGFGIRMAIMMAVVGSFTYVVFQMEKAFEGKIKGLGLDEHKEYWAIYWMRKVLVLSALIGTGSVAITIIKAFN